MAEEITKYVVSIGFDAAIKSLNNFSNKMAKMEKGRESALKRQIALQKKLNALMTVSPQKTSAPQTRKPRKGKSGIEGGFFDIKLNKVNTKASATLFADTMRKEAASDKSMSKPRKSSGGIQGGFFDLNMGKASNKAKDTAFADDIRKEDSRIKALNKQIALANRYRMVLNEQGDELSKNTSEIIRQGILQKKTGAEVKDLVFQEKIRLSTARRNTKQIQKQNFLLNRMQTSSKQMAGNMASAFAVGAGVSFVTKTGQDFESVNNTMLAVSTNSKEAGNNFSFVRDEAFRLGLGLKQAASGFAKMVAARGNLTLEETKKAFTGISEMGTLLGLSAEEGGRAINALQQMMSKGVVSAEELKLQMGEVLPNAIPLMAKAAKDAGLTLNGTVEEMMALQKAGGLISSKVLPFFSKRLSDAARNNGGLENALLSNRVAMNRFTFSVAEAADTFFKSNFSEGLTEFFNISAESIRKLSPLWKSLGRIIGSVLKLLAKTVKAITPTILLLGRALDSLTTSLGDSYAALALLLSPMVLANLGLLSTVLGTVLLPVVAIAKAFEHAAFWAEELINAFVTQDKIGVLFDPRKGQNQSIAKNILSEGIEPGLSSPFQQILPHILRMVNSVGGGGASSNNKNGSSNSKPINISLELKEEQIGRILIETEEMQSGIDARISPYLSGGF